VGSEIEQRAPTEPQFDPSPQFSSSLLLSPDPSESRDPALKAALKKVALKIGKAWKIAAFASLALAIAFSVAAFHIYPKSQRSFDTATNGIWIGHRWYTGRDVGTGDRVPEAEIDALVERLRNGGIRYIYLHAGPLLADGTIADSADPFFADLRRAYPEGVYLAWLGARIETVQLGEAAWRRAVVQVVERMAADLACTVSQLMADDNLRKKIKLEQYVTDQVGMPTLLDIMDELAKPGRDPRQTFESFRFDESVNKIEDLTVGMTLPGIVTNVTAFGAFVDVGVHQDGLVHISEMADRFVKDPNEIVKVHQKIRVTVLDVDLPRKRIALSMRQAAEA